MRSFNCPNCKAALSIEDGKRDFVFCQYCGSKISLDDFTSTFRYVNEAEVIQSETDKLIQLKKLEMEEKRREIENHNKKIRIIIAIIIALIGIIMIILGEFKGKASGDNNSEWYMFEIIGMIVLAIGIGIAIVDN